MWCVARFDTIYAIYKLSKTLLYGCFSRFLNCTNGTKSRIASHKYRLKLRKFENTLSVKENKKCFPHT